MIIKNYIQFIKESSGYQYGCVMIEIPISNWQEITKNKDKFTFDFLVALKRLSLLRQYLTA